MADFGETVVFDAIDTFAHASSPRPFGSAMTYQSFTNRSANTAVDLSWDGINVHRVVLPGETAPFLAPHERNRVWVRRNAPVGGGTHNLVIQAWTT